MSFKKILKALVEAAIIALKEKFSGKDEGGAAPDQEAREELWCYGGEDGSKAVEVEGCTIADLCVSSSGLRYRWTSGGCEMLGARSADDASCLACLFIRDGAGTWRGGKFDWISTTRTTRDFKNIRGFYKGWPEDAIENAEAFRFCVLSADCKKRTNFIETKVLS